MGMLRHFEKIEAFIFDMPINLNIASPKIKSFEDIGDSGFSFFCKIDESAGACQWQKIKLCRACII
jgi:hypothetical protein